MDRRALLTAIVGAAAAGACTRRDDDGAGTDRAGRPTLAIDSEGPGRWRIRSWQWRANAWRPRIARARRAGGKIEIDGAIDAADRAEVIARLGA
jgi:hypothetical protein